MTSKLSIVIFIDGIDNPRADPDGRGDLLAATGFLYFLFNCNYVIRYKERLHARRDYKTTKLISADFVLQYY